MTQPRIVLLHATPVAIDPVHAAFAEKWPQAELVNLLDDGLSVDRAKEDDVSERMVERFLMLGRYALHIGADGLLATCSAFGPAIERMAAELAIPVLKPNEAMFETALASGNRIGMVVTFPPARASMEAEFAEEAARRHSEATLSTIVISGAMDALRKGDTETHNRLIAERGPELDRFDAVMLAHFSTSRAAPALRKTTKAPVLTSPDAAVAKMQRLVRGQGQTAQAG